MKSFLVGLLLFFSSLTFAAPFVSPSQCAQLAQEVYAIGVLRDEGLGEKDLLNEIENLTGNDKFARAFYFYWIKLVYASPDVKPETLGMEFYTRCVAEQGDLEKLVGNVV